MGYRRVMSGGEARVMGRVRVRVRVSVQHALFRPCEHRPALDKARVGYGVSRETAQCAEAERGKIQPEYPYVQAAVDAKPAYQPTRAVRRLAAQPFGSGSGLGLGLGLGSG